MAILSGHRIIHDLAPTNCSADFWMAFLYHLRQSTCAFPEVPYLQSLSEKFIHVFDDASYANVLSELDTIQDFLMYLDARQELLLIFLRTFL